jgi:regulator of nucleoside diphosphate kinase
MASTLPVITELDAARIRELAARARVPGGLPALGELIDWVHAETDVVPSDRIAPDVVTLGSLVSFKEVGLKEVHRVSVVHPVDASIPERRISVLSPVGRALLGRRVGQRSQVAMPGGSARSIEVLKVHYQPEAAGVIRP